MHRAKTVVRSDGGFFRAKGQGLRDAGYPPHPSRAFYGITIPKVVWGRDTCLACRSRLPGLGCRVSAAASVVAFACGKGRHWRPATSVVASLREVSTGHPQLGRCFCGDAAKVAAGTMTGEVVAAGPRPAAVFAFAWSPAPIIDRRENVNSFKKRKTTRCIPPRFVVK